MLVPLSSSSIEVVQCVFVFFISECPALSENFEGYVIVQRSKLSTSPETGVVSHLVQTWQVFQDGLHWKWTTINGN